jgi:type III restriction enzyme
VRYAAQPIVLLADEWRKKAEEWKTQYAEGRRRSGVPPVFIIVCRNTALAKLLYEWLANGEGGFGQGIPEFRNSPGNEMTVRIDSKVSEDVASGGSEDEARRLRFILETVGKTEWPGKKIPEEYEALIEKRHNRKALEDDESDVVTVDPAIPPGRDVRCIISVAMLSEGWDATTVTHVVGLRPFGSQLLCEQVVGRALRRTSYAVDPETGFFREETAKVFGVPFELIPFKVEGTQAPGPTPPINHIFAVPDKARYEIEFPMVEGYQDPGITRIAIDWKLVAPVVLDSAEFPDAALMQGLATQDGALAAYGPGAPELVSLDAWRERTRVQQVAFLLARELTKAWIDEKGHNIPTHVLFPMLLEAVTRFLAEKVTCKGTRVVQDVAINPYFGRVKGALLEALIAVDESGASRERPIVAGVRSTKWVDFHTGKDIAPVQKCHLNAGVFDTKKFEQQAAFVLDTSPAVDRWVKNERLGFVIPYRRDGVLRRYFPDFIVVLTSGDILIVETKGKEGADVPLKEKAALRWCQAINNDGRFGRWSYHLVWEVGELNRILREKGDEGKRRA